MNIGVTNRFGDSCQGLFTGKQQASCTIHPDLFQKFRERSACQFSNQMAGSGAGNEKFSGDIIQREPFMGMISNIAADAHQPVVVSYFATFQFSQQSDAECVQKFSQAGQFFRFRFRQIPDT